MYVYKKSVNSTDRDFHASLCNTHSDFHVEKTVKRTQNKSLQILNFKGPQESVDYLHKESKFDKLKNIIIKANCRLVYDQLKNNLPETFNNFVHSKHPITQTQH